MFACKLILDDRAHLVSDVESPFATPIKINQDANIFVAELEAGRSATLKLDSGRQGYLVCIEDDVVVSGTNGLQSNSLERHDAAEIYGETEFTVTNSGSENSKSHLLFVEMPYTGQGRTDIP
jgi:redox-sensitive bicupin YhaK (pirin superfamily)